MTLPNERLDAARRGDPDALDELLRVHLPGLRAFVRLRFGAALAARESVSDVVQSACREVLKNFDRFADGGDDEFRRWLYTAALRKIRKRAAFWRAERRDIERERFAHDEADDRALLETCRSIATPSEHAIGREQARRFEEVFDRLSADEREVILLARVLGLQHRDVAAQLERSEGACRVLLHRALAKLARLMDGSPPPDLAP